MTVSQRRRCGRSRVAAARAVVRDAGGRATRGAALWVSRLVVWAAARRAAALWGVSRARRLLRPGRGHRGRSARSATRSSRRSRAGTASGTWRSPTTATADDPRRAAFFPLYPLLVRAGDAVVGSPARRRARSSRSSCFGVALVAPAPADGARARRRRPRATTVWALALLPGAFFFSAVYSEALFLALSVGCRLRGAHRPLGVGRRARRARRRDPQRRASLLVVPLAVMWLARADGRPRRAGDAAWLALVAARPRARSAACSRSAGGDALAPFHAQDIWFRHFAGPFVGAVGRHRAPRGTRRGSSPSATPRCARGGDVVPVRQNLMPAFLRAVPVVVGVAPAAAARLRRVRASSRSRCRCPIRSARSR